MRSILACSIILFFAFTAVAQKKSNVPQKKSNVTQKSDFKWENDTVYKKNKALFVCKGKVDKNKSIYMLRNLDNKSLAFINLEELDTVLKTIVSFPLLELKFGVYFPKIKVDVLLEAFVNHRIIDNGEINVDSLKGYCLERGIELQHIDRKKVAKPRANDSTLLARTRIERESRIKFDVINTLQKPVSVRIGTASNYRIVAVKAGSSLNESGHEKDSVCILDIHLKPVECRPVAKGVEHFKVNSGGNGFE